MFILSDSPPEKDVQWSEEGINSSYKFIQKLWNLNSKIIEEIKKDHQKDYDEEIAKFTNSLIKKITENLENFSYNKIVANLHEMYSFMFKQLDKKYSKETLIENYKKILMLMSPVIPHLASECLNIIGIEKNIKWPEHDKKLLQNDNVIIVVQINGKKRGIINLEKETKEDELLKIIQKDEKIKKYLKEQAIKKRIYVKNKIMNIII